jgi:hypothetical protein
MTIEMASAGAFDLGWAVRTLPLNRECLLSEGLAFHVLKAGFGVEYVGGHKQQLDVHEDLFKDPVGRGEAPRKG